MWAFKPSGGAVSSIQFPGSSFTQVWGINNSDELAGRYIGPADSLDHGFSYSAGIFSSITMGSFVDTDVTGLNNIGDLVGDFHSPSGGIVSGFLTRGGTTATFDNLFPIGVNDSDQIVGTAVAGYGFLRLADGSIQQLDFIPSGINDDGVTVGANEIRIGISDYKATLAGFSGITLEGINNRDEVVGYGVDPSGGTEVFTAQISTTPEAGSAALTAAGVLLAIGLGVGANRRVQSTDR